MRHSNVGPWLISLLLPLGTPLAAQPTVLPDTVTPVQMSNSDINRVVCTDGAINDAFFSSEKGIAVENVGSNSFIKFLIKEDGLGLTEHVTTRSEFYIVCAGSVYTLLVDPKDGLPGQTIRLSSGATKRVEANQALLSPMPDEDRAVFITLAALHDDIPDSFTVSNHNEDWQASSMPSITLAKRRSIRVDGIGLKLDEYLVQSTQHQVFDELQFLMPELGNSIFAITLDPMQLSPGQVGRAFVVQREVGQ